jgi:hypothetical protein
MGKWKTYVEILGLWMFKVDISIVGWDMYLCMD